MKTNREGSEGNGRGHFKIPQCRNEELEEVKEEDT
jgi:hypothetical protein